MQIDIHDRSFLNELSEIAYNHAQNERLAPAWKHAYLNLFQAADYLDALHGRSSVPAGTCTIPEHQQ